MDKTLADLIRISNITGKDSSLVQGGGGNTSVKTADGKYMYIKASGTALKDMNGKRGWRRLRLDAILSIIEDKTLAKLKAGEREHEVVNRLLLACDDDVTGDARPSIESHLHAFLDRYVIHLHPLVVTAYVNAKNGKQELERLFKKIENRPASLGLDRTRLRLAKIVSSLPPLWVPYAEPGFMLARQIANLIANYQKQNGKKPKILFLQKHGLIISAKRANDALQLVRKVIKICSSKLKEPKARKMRPPRRDDIVAVESAIRKAVFNVTGQYLPVSYYPADKTIISFMRRKDAAELLATDALNPGEQIYANGPAMWVESCDVGKITAKLRSRINRGRKPAVAFVVKGLGLFIAADKKIAPVVAEITSGSLLVRMHAARFGGVLALTKHEQNSIDNWESEAFYKKSADGQI